MATRKRRVIVPRQRSGNGGAEITFGTALKWMAGIGSALTVAAFSFLGAWIWNTSETVTKHQAAIESLTKANESQDKVSDVQGQRIDRVSEAVVNHGAALATIQVQITAAQTASATAQAATNERVRQIEQQQMWRERWQQ